MAVSATSGLSHPSWTSACLFIKEKSLVTTVAPPSLCARRYLTFLRSPKTKVLTLFVTAFPTRLRFPICHSETMLSRTVFPNHRCDRSTCSRLLAAKCFVAVARLKPVTGICIKKLPGYTLELRIHARITSGQRDSVTVALACPSLYLFSSFLFSGISFYLHVSFPTRCQYFCRCISSLLLCSSSSSSSVFFACLSSSPHILGFSHKMFLPSSSSFPPFA